MRIKRMLKKFIDRCKRFWGQIVSWTQKLKHKKFAGWILSAISVTVLIGIGIAVNRYFLYTSNINCLEQFNVFKILFLSNSPEDIECIKQSGFWKKLSSAEEPLNIRNMLLGFAGMVGLGLAGWRSWVGERQTRATEERRVEERWAEQRSKERRLDERFANAVASLSKDLNETSYPAHLGAITALRDLALDNNAYIQRCLDILCSCNQWMESHLENFMVPFSHGCYADIHLTEDNRIVKDERKGGHKIKLEQERRSQQTLLAVSYVIKKLGNDNAKKHILGELDLSGKMLCGINLSRAEIAGINLKNAYLNGASFEYSNLRKAKLFKAQMRGTSMRRAQMQNVNITSAQLQGSNLRKVNLQGSVIVFTKLHGANCKEAQMQGADCYSAQLQGADLSKVQMQGANLFNAQMQGANLSSAKLQRTFFTAARLQGADFTNAQMQGTDLCNAQMQGANMTATNFQGADLTRADISGSRLLKSNLYGAKMTDTKFVNVMFDTISKQGHIQEQDKREEFINDLRDKFFAYNEDVEFIKIMQDAWNNADNEVIPEGLDALHKASILKQDSEGSWIIMPFKIGGLEDFYRKLVTEIDLGKGILEPRIADLINNANEPFGYVRNNYSKIEASLVKIWKELEREFLDKEE